MAEEDNEGAAMEAEEYVDVDENDPLLLKTKKRKLKHGDLGGSPPKKKKKKKLAPDYEPRSYQSEALEKAMAQNTIVFLDAGSGKTFIAVMLLNKLAHKLSTEHRMAIFLAPTVPLVMQQADAISQRTELRVGVYQTDSWDCKKWSEQCTSQQVLVMTPQIFYNALQLAALNMEGIEVIIFDECHHAHKNHPYASIMKTYYHSLASERKPKIFGMTASLVATKGATNLKILELESMLDSKIYTLTNRTELEAKAPTPHQSSKFYSKPPNSFRDLRASLNSLVNKYQQEILLSNSSFSDEKDAKKRVSKSISTIYNAIDTCLSEIGLWGANLAADLYSKEKSCMFSMGNDSTVESEGGDADLQQRFLKDASELLRKFTPAEGFEKNITSPEDMKMAINEGLLTPKLEALVVLLTRYRSVENFRCIVFVERVIISVVVSNLLSCFTCLHFIRCEYMVGVNADASNRSHRRTLERFQAGTVNVLIATSVAEEGLDIQLCNSVIRFNLSRTVRSFIQSRGRARIAGADYIWLLERGNLDDENLLMEMIKSEKTMREEALSRMEKPVRSIPLPDQELEVFQSGVSGIRMSTAGSVSFLFTYCSQLSGDKYYRPRPEFTITKCDSIEEQFKCTITFPPNAPFRHLEGPARRNKDLAKKVACLEACRRLDSMGILKKPSVEDRMASKDPSGSGSTLLKELFPSIKSTTLQGNWLMSETGASLYLYALTFTSEQDDDDQGYMNFVFLINSRLDDDVGNFDLSLYISSSKSVKARLSFMKECWLDSAQLTSARVFQEVIFNGAFNRLVFREDAADRTIAKCLLTYEPYKKELWSQMYVLLPMNPHSGDIDWPAVSKTMEAAKVFPHHSTVLRRDTPENRSSVSLETPDAHVIHTAGGPVHPAALQDTVVLTVHTGKLFCITQVLHNVNARTTFPKTDTSEPGTYESFYIRKHGRLLQHQGQPMLRAKPTHAVHNHLINPHASKRRVAKNAPDNLVELPPELCLVLGLRSTLVRSLYLIPSFMYRFTSLIVAGELREKFTKHAPCAHVSSILEALTSTRCSEGFSYEALELFGDSVLKYAVSRKLFLAYAEKHEGQLSGWRSQAICNATLRKLAVQQDLPSYIRDEPFYPSLWLGAGMYRLRKRKCLCRLSNLAVASSSQSRPTKLSFYIGKSCGEGHRWMCSKTTSDVLEALIGAYAVGGGFPGALEFMKAFKLDVDFDSCLIAAAQQCPAVPEKAVHQHLATLSSLEKRLSYSFHNKALLLQAITHPSAPESSFCYQRLEFLGDAALDLLMTQHFVQTHPGLTPGLFSDLRAAAVNNDCFARVAVKHGLHTYLRHDSGELQAEVLKFLSTMEKKDVSFGFNSLSGPKVLGDLVESIVGAMLVDMGFDLERLWTLVKPLLSPLVTPATLVFHPIRECLELCGLKYFDWHWNLSKPGVTIELCVRIDDQMYTESSLVMKKKEAKKEAAEKMLSTLKKLGYRHPRWDWTVPSDSEAVHPVSYSLVTGAMSARACIPSIGPDTELIVPDSPDRLTPSNQQPDELSKSVSIDSCGAPPIYCNGSSAQKPQPMYCNDELTKTTSSQSCGTPPVYRNGSSTQESRPMDCNGSLAEKPQQPMDCTGSFAGKPQLMHCNGSAVEKPPKMILHELCSKKKWAQPKYEEHDAQGSAHRRWFSFRISMDIPGIGDLEHVSCLKANKKRAMDDAAEKMIAQLKSLNILV